MHKFKEGDEIWIGGFTIKKSKFIKDFGNYFSCDHSIDGPDYWKFPHGKNKNELIDSLIKALNDCRGNNDEQ